ncbi:MAG: heme ABC exporter ATP-binding protein CcmA [Hyphomicrobiaceae bacterium]
MALVVENLTVRRGERTILAGLSLRADAGAALLLTGPNGAGKTTLIRAVAGLLPVAEGRIRLEGTDQDADLEVSERCHYVGHLNGIKPALTVSENALFWANYLGGTMDDVTAALDQFRLLELGPIRAGYLSAGQKRRLGLSRLLVARRPVWLMDEPAVSLDKASQGLLAEAANKHLANGGIVVAATHQPLGFAPAIEHALQRVDGAASRPAAAAP